MGKLCVNCCVNQLSKLSVVFFLEWCNLGSNLVQTEYEYSDPATEILRPIVFQHINNLLCVELHTLLS
jgi:hypothetical protein